LYLFPENLFLFLSNGAKVTNKTFFVLNHVSDGAEACLEGKEKGKRKKAKGDRSVAKIPRERKSVLITHNDY
jgi:hypothetical protein